MPFPTNQQATNQRRTTPTKDRGLFHIGSSLPGSYQYQYNSLILHKRTILPDSIEGMMKLGFSLVSFVLLVANVNSFGTNKIIKKRTLVRVSARARTALPKLDPATSQYAPPPELEPSKFYSPTSTLLRAGPVPFVTRLVSPEKYEQAVYKYMNEAREASLQTAQGNMDAFFAAPDVWAEQKLMEQKGQREVYDYGKGPESGRVVLSTVWGGSVILLILRVLWQVAHGEGNLF